MPLPHVSSQKGESKGGGRLGPRCFHRALELCLAEVLVTHQQVSHHQRQHAVLHSVEPPDVDGRGRLVMPLRRIDSLPPK